MIHIMVDFCIIGGKKKEAFFKTSYLTADKEAILSFKVREKREMFQQHELKKRGISKRNFQ